MKTERKRTLKGTVLFTVVSVMALMIIVLTSTLAMATAANRRAHKSYASSQTSYTARAAIDSILAAMSADKDFANAVGGIKSAANNFDVIVDMQDPSLGTIDKARVEYAGTKTMYDPDEKKWVKRTLVKITADVILNGETTTISSHVILDPVDYDDDPPPPPTSTMGAAADTQNHLNTCGGTFLGMGINDQTAKTYLDGVINGEIDDMTGLPKQLAKNAEGNMPYWSGEKFSVGRDYDTYEAPFVVNGDLSVDTKMSCYIQKYGTGMVVWGDMKVTESELFNITSYGDINVWQSKDVWENGDKTPREVNFNETPYLYVDGELKFSSGMKALGDGTIPLNIFCGTFNTSGNEFKTGADIYCMDEGETSVFGVNSSSSLYNWAGSVWNGGLSYPSMEGSIYSNGNVEFGAGQKTVLDLGGDLHVAGNLVLKENMELKVHGDVVVGGDIIFGNNAVLNVVNSGDNEIYCNPADLPSKDLTGGTKVLKDGYSEIDAPCIPCYQCGKTYEWCKAGILDAQAGKYTAQDFGTNEFKFTYYDFSWHCPEDQIKEYMVAEIGWFDGGINQKFYDHIKDATESGSIPTYKAPAKNGVVVPESEAYGYTGDIKYKGVTVKPIASYPTSVYPSTAKRAVLMGLEPATDDEGNLLEMSQTKLTKTVPEYMEEWDLYTTADKVDPVKNGKKIRNTTDFSNPITESIVVDDNLNGKTITIQQPLDGEIWVYINNKSISGTKFIIDDTDEYASGNVKFYFEGKNCSFCNKSEITTKSFLNLYDSKKDIEVLSDKEDHGYLSVEGRETLPIPPVYVYSANDTTVDLQNGAFFTAFIIAPYMTVKAMSLPVPYDAVLDRLYYDGINLAGVKGGGLQRMFCIGSFDVHELISQNNLTVLFINPTEKKGVGVAANGKFSYAAVDYDAY